MTNTSKRAIPKGYCRTSPSMPALPNIHHPPNERQRVRQACESCRKKKLKCSGEDPCQRCKAFGVDCDYVEADQGLQMAGAMVQGLENRVASIEQQFGGAIESIWLLLQKLSDQIGEGHQTGLGTTTGNGQKEHAQDNRSSEAEAEQLNSVGNSRVLKSPSVHRMQQTTFQNDPNAGSMTVLKPNNSEQIDDVSYGGGNSANVSHLCCYADEYGQLLKDVKGLRYVGIGSTGFVVDRCSGLHQHIAESMRMKGFVEENELCTDPTSTVDHVTTSSIPSNKDWGLPSPEMVDVLFKTFAEKVETLFPVISIAYLRAIYDGLRESSIVDVGHAAIFFAALAAASPLTSPNQQFRDSRYSDATVGPDLYNLSQWFASCGPDTRGYKRGDPQDIVIAYVLLSLYLSETGSQAEAWILTGRAIRAGQDIGLHRSPERLRLPPNERHNRRLIWWCLYLIDKQLSFALGRPVMIDPEDCDVEFPSESDDTGEVVEVEPSAFPALIQLYDILGNIHKVVNSVRNAKRWRKSASTEELSDKVRQLHLSLQEWVTEKVPQVVKRADHGKLLIGAQLCLSTYHLAMIELYRSFMPHPHRKSPIDCSEAVSRCADASSLCIRGSGKFLESVPRGHYHVLHGQTLFVCAIIQLQRSRYSDDSTCFDSALKDTKLALAGLEKLEATWRGAVKSQRIIKEYMDFAILVHQGFYKRGVCNFSHVGDACTHSTSKTNNLAKRVHTPPTDESGWPGQPRPLKRQRQAKDQAESAEAESSVQGEANSEGGDWDRLEGIAIKLPGATQSAFQDQDYCGNNLQKDCGLEGNVGQAVDHFSGFDQLLQATFDGEMFVSDDQFDISAMPSSFWAGPSY